MLSNGQIVLEQEILGSLFKNEDLIIKAVNDNITMNRKWKIKMYKNDH